MQTEKVTVSNLRYFYHHNGLNKQIYQHITKIDNKYKNWIQFQWGNMSWNVQQASCCQLPAINNHDTCIHTHTCTHKHAHTQMHNCICMCCYANLDVYSLIQLTPVEVVNCIFIVSLVVSWRVVCAFEYATLHGDLQLKCTHICAQIFRSSENSQTALVKVVATVTFCCCCFCSCDSWRPAVIYINKYHTE